MAPARVPNVLRYGITRSGKAGGGMQGQPHSGAPRGLPVGLGLGGPLAAPRAVALTQGTELLGVQRS